MDILTLKQKLDGKTHLGIPYIPTSCFNSMLELFKWSLEGKPEEGRQVWFAFANPATFTKSLSSYIRCRILALSEQQATYYLKTTPSDSLLLHISFATQDPNTLLTSFWQARGSYEKQSLIGEFTLWFWKPNNPPLYIYGIDHHHAVLWDAKQVLRPLGIYLHFVWLCDGREPVNEAIPSQDPPFYNSLNIYKESVDFSLGKEFIDKIQSTFDAILTSHSLVTAYRLRTVPLPQFHINSTRFGNEWVADPKKHTILVESLQDMLNKNKLTIVHNNKADCAYAHQFLHIKPQQELILPSTCQQISRKRFDIVSPMKFLIWDTRQVLIQQNKSPFMKQLFEACIKKYPDAFDSQAILLAKNQHFLPEGYLDAYTAILHLPYNISTMSIFEQVAANIPVWVPSKKLLQKLWTDLNEPNELSWTVFNEGSEKHASFMDQARNPETVAYYTELADFYTSPISDCIFTFDSIEDLLERIFKENYREKVEKNTASFLKRQENTTASWELLFKPLRKFQKN